MIPIQSSSSESSEETEKTEEKPDKGPKTDTPSNCVTTDGKPHGADNDSGCNYTDTKGVDDKQNEGFDDKDQDENPDVNDHDDQNDKDHPNNFNRLDCPIGRWERSYYFATLKPKRLGSIKSY